MTKSSFSDGLVRLTLADGLGFLAALLELHATPPGQAAVGIGDTGSWDECQEMIVRMHAERWYIR